MFSINVEEFTPEFLIFVVGIVQSLFFEYVPGVEKWYGALGDKVKRLIQAGLLLVITLVVFGLGCANVLGGIECDQASAISLLVVFFTALTGNQITHRVFRKQHAEDPA